MKYSQAKTGRVFVARLYEGDVVHECIEQLAADENISAASLLVIGGARGSSALIVGPEDGDARPVVPMRITLGDTHEVAGVGTIFPDETGQPILHMHFACGRGESTRVGCVRAGVVVWQVMEVVIQEITDTTGVRKPDEETGFSLLNA